MTKILIKKDVKILPEFFEQELMDDEDTLGNRYLTFMLDKEVYGIELKNVTEIVGIQAITAVPEMPDYIPGIINLRGNIFPVMDVRLRFKKNFQEYSDRTCVIVVQISNMSLGLIVDGVSDVITIPQADIVPPPELSKSNEKFLFGIGKVGDDVKLLLDCEKLIDAQIQI